MSVFKDYAAYYDMLYKDKDYKGEAAYVHKLIQEHKPGAKTILNLGCGTGSHDFELEKLGYEVVGVDLSTEMIEIANQKKTKNQSKVDFHVGDLREFRIDQKFDAVVSLFHVMSYQTTNEDLKAAFETALIHLDIEGVFLFDCWYGPGVLNDPPVVRHRVLENDELRIHRIATPVMYYEDNCVDVNYTILVHSKITNEDYEVEETHKMRYLFLSELKIFFQTKDKNIYHFNDNNNINIWNLTLLIV